ncbi:uncharacterized protein N7511_008915 [Penicillium nucicola]|uniref:uncharacterized protein n=1 Tax=Penicillium nucicola TaxID=1850975 RepID=UPI002545433E|nr:uncharacterized protein N7511_008915 [Penicillium nucicola]KAJ5747219.1 hypothetical protein N7511_008915 [Penicillium nucicola]
MRQSMRLPLREAKYVCSNCRVGANPRISPLNQQFLRNASDSPGFLERTRRQIWGTDKPPGPQDPYSGSQIMPQEDSAAELTTLSPGKREEEPQIAEEVDIESMDWKSMPRVGYTLDEEWRVNGQTVADKVSPWYKTKSPVPFEKAVQHAVIEFSVMNLIGMKYATSYHKYPTRHGKDLSRHCSIEGESAEWGDRVRFSKELVREDLINYFGRLAKRNVEEPSAYIQAQDGGKIRDDQISERPQNGKKIENTMSSLPLNDPKLKFAFLNRLSQLTGQRIPDAIYSSGNTTTVGSVISAYNELTKQSIKMTPVRLHEQLAAAGTESLSNVKIYDSRRTRHDNDEDVGRKKLIIASLYEDGLITHPLGKRREWIRMQKKQEIKALKAAAAAEAVAEEAAQEIEIAKAAAEEAPQEAKLQMN